MRRDEPERGLVANYQTESVNDAVDDAVEMVDHEDDIFRSD